MRHLKSTVTCMPECQEEADRFQQVQGFGFGRVPSGREAKFLC